jgi:hypothetical protein
MMEARLFPMGSPLWERPEISMKAPAAIAINKAATIMGISIFSIIGYFLLFQNSIFADIITSVFEAFSMPEKF